MSSEVIVVCDSVIRRWLCCFAFNLSNGLKLLLFLKQGWLIRTALATRPGLITFRVWFTLPRPTIVCQSSIACVPSLSFRLNANPKNIAFLFTIYFSPPGWLNNPTSQKNNSCEAFLLQLKCRKFTHVSTCLTFPPPSEEKTNNQKSRSKK